MKKTLYYSVQKELISVGEVEETTGYKTVNVYSIENQPQSSEPKLEMFFSFDLLNEDCSKEEILEYLNDNGYGDDEFELIML